MRKLLPTSISIHPIVQDEELFHYMPSEAEIREIEIGKSSYLSILFYSFMVDRWPIGYDPTTGLHSQLPRSYHGQSVKELWFNSQRTIGLLANHHPLWIKKFTNNCILEPPPQVGHQFRFFQILWRLQRELNNQNVGNGTGRRRLLWSLWFSVPI